MEGIEKDFRKLEKLIKATKLTMPTIRVGVLGGHDNREGNETGMPGNAEIGAKHEFGKEGMPMRSWLRMPLTNEFKKMLEKSNAFNKDTLAQVVQQANFLPWALKLGLVAENTIHEAFETTGFGTWKPSNMSRKTNQQTLVETGQLRDAVLSEVK